MSGTSRKRTQVIGRDEDLFITARRPGETRDDGCILLDERDAMTLFYQLADQLAQREDLQPKWEIGVCEADDTDNWEFYHPDAPDRRVACERALEEASDDFDEPVVYMTSPIDFETDWEPWFTDDYDSFLQNKGVFRDVE
jgi:hypothetical protein